MMKPRAHYRKPKKDKRQLFATLRIVLTALVVSILGIIFFSAWTYGWESVFAWFGGRYACMVFIIALVGITAGAWLWMVVKMMRRLRENE